MDSTEPGTLGFASLNLSEPGRKKFAPDFLKGGVVIGPDSFFVSRTSSVELRQSKRAARRTGRPSPGADGLRKPRVHRGRGIDGLWW